MPDTTTPRAAWFPAPDPFALREHSEFMGWPSQLLSELRALLGQRDAAWMNEVAALIYSLMQDPALYVPAVTEKRTSLAVTEEMAQTLSFDYPGQIGAFASIEASYPWEHASPHTQRWERFAVFSLMELSKCVRHLGERSSQPEVTELQGMFNAAGGFALGSMRGLQIAVSLKATDQDKSALGKKAAVARHSANKQKHAEALALANSRPFTTKEQALEFITNNLAWDAEGTRYVSRRAAGEWLRAAGWKPRPK